MNIIKKLSDEMHKSSLSISEISRKSGISRPMLYMIIKGEVTKLSSDTIEAICKAINISPSSVYSEAGVKSQEQPDKINTIVLFGRGEGRTEYQVSEEEMKALKALIETMKGKPSDDNY